VTTDPAELIEWLYGLNVHGIKLGLGNTRELLHRLGDPQDSFSSLHVAGTDGKGSVCAMLYSVLSEAGFRTGLYTSPHLISFNERIRTCAGPVTDEEILELAEVIVPAVKSMEAEGKYCTFFEATTAMAFLHFRDEGVETAVIEVGMGGRFDSTNVITPLASAVNNIGLEHTEYLGDTIEKIAFEKAGIIKPGVPVATLNQEPALGVIRAAAEDRGSPFTAVDPGDVHVLSNTYKGVDMEYLGQRYHVGIPGRDQARNAALVLETLRASGLGISREQVSRGLSNVKWPCRLEYIEGEDLIIDVTHTAPGSAALASDVSEIYGEVTLVFGVLGDKDIEAILSNLSRISKQVVLTMPESERAAPEARIREVAGRYFREVLFEGNVGDAIIAARRIGGGRTVLVTGSLYMAGDALKWLGRTSV
jgi:dihydrofolate synthase / folylpolyglutamate synthase